MMAKLIFSLDHMILDEFPLDKARTTIGRKPTNDIHIDNLAVSGDHAIILKMGNDYYIEDLQSTNGTEVNDKLVKSYLLQPGDLISFGKHQLKFVLDVKTQNNEPVFEKTVYIRPSELKQTHKLTPMPEQAGNLEHLPALGVEKTDEVNVVGEEQVVVAAASAPPIALGRIQVLNGSSAGRELVLNKALTTLGKAGVQVAVITRRPHGYFITHVEGKVMPMVNGASTGMQAFALSDHDVVELAGVRMEFYLEKK